MSVDEINQKVDELITDVNFQLLGDTPLPPGLVFALADLHKHLVDYNKIVGDFK